MVRPDAGARRGSFSTGPLPVERFFQFSLLGLVASGYLAVAGSAYLDVPTIVLTGGGILLRALMLAGLVRLNLTTRAATIAARDAAIRMARLRGVMGRASHRYASRATVQATGSPWATYATIRTGTAAANRRGFHCHARAKAQKHNPRLR